MSPVALLQLILGLLPASPTKNRLLSLTSKSWSIAPTARVAPNFFFGVQSVQLADHAIIRPFNTFRGLRRLVMAEEAEIASLNWISGAGSFMPTTNEEMRGSLVIKKAGTIVSRHLLDCSGGISIGEYSGIAGYKCTVMTHSIDVMNGGQSCAPVILEDRSLLSVGCTVLPGVTIGPRAIVGAGAVVVKDLTEPDRLYGGVPAKAIGSMQGAELMDRDYARITSEEEQARLKAEAQRQAR